MMQMYNPPHPYDLWLARQKQSEFKVERLFTASLA
jgi:hypothetical protein